MLLTKKVVVSSSLEEERLIRFKIKLHYLTESTEYSFKRCRKSCRKCKKYASGAEIVSRTLKIGGPV